MRVVHVSSGILSLIAHLAVDIYALLYLLYEGVQVPVGVCSVEEEKD